MGRELLGVVPEVQDHKKIKFQMATLGLKGLICCVCVCVDIFV